MIAVRKILISCICFLLLSVYYSFAEEFRLPDSCYQLIGEEITGAPKEALFLLIDNSVDFDTGVINSIQEKIEHWIGNNKSIEIYNFSMYSQQTYTNKVLAGNIDQVPSEDFMDNLKKSLRIKFERCMKSYIPLVKIQIQKATVEVFKKSSSNISRTEIINNIKKITQHIKEHPAKKKLILIVSDMLENSSMQAFYEGNKVKLINPELEFKKVTTNNLLSDLDKATVYIIGLGYIPDNNREGKNQSVSLQTRKALESFWIKYIENSNGKIGEIGTPLIFGDLK